MTKKSDRHEETCYELLKRLALDFARRHPEQLPEHLRKAKCLKQKQEPKQ